MDHLNLSQFSIKPIMDKRKWLVFLVIFATHTLLALYYKQVLGVSIEGNLGNRSWDWWWQTISADLLVNDLWRSLWYLHSQPPLFNLYGAFFFRFFPNNPLEIMYINNILLGSLIAGMIYVSLVMVTGKQFLSTFIGLAVALDPTLFLFEAYILYDLLTTFLIVLSVVMLIWFVKVQSTRIAALFFICLSTLVLTRSVYHLVIIHIGVLIVFLSSKKNNSKRILLVGLLIGCIPLGWYVKNYLLFDFFGASSWQGFGLWKVVADDYSPEELQRLATNEIIPPIVAELEVLRSPSTYTLCGFNRSSEVSVLNQDDRHNINILDVAPIYQKSALELIKRDPLRYLRSTMNAYGIFNIPGAHFKHHRLNAEKISLHVWLMANMIHGSWLANHIDYRASSIFFFLIPISILVYGLIFLNYLVRRRGAFLFFKRYSIEGWIIFLIVYTTLVSIFFEIGENNREKFYIEYLVILYLIFIFTRLISNFGKGPGNRERG
jgi:hypothetical protein